MEELGNGLTMMVTMMSTFPTTFPRWQKTTNTI